MKACFVDEFVQQKRRGEQCSGKAVNFTREILGSRLVQSAPILNGVLMFFIQYHHEMIA
jgi:hypothetical protein